MSAKHPECERSVSGPPLPVDLSGYSSWREFCGLSVPNTTADLATVLGNRPLAHKFLELYGTARNIDVWVGAISEPALAGGRVGPLLSSLLARQFRALRDGDRYRLKAPHGHTVNVFI